MRFKLGEIYSLTFFAYKYFKKDVKNLIENLVDTFEELKKYDFIISFGNNNKIILRFNDDNFYHLVGLHKTNIDLYFPNNMKSKSKKYKYLKSHAKKFNSILQAELNGKTTLMYRIHTFSNIIGLLHDNEKTMLYKMNEKVNGSLYNGDFSLYKLCNKMYCLLGLICERKINNEFFCIPQSWMANNRPNKLVKTTRAIDIKNIEIVPILNHNTNKKISVLN